MSADTSTAKEEIAMGQDLRYSMSSPASLGFSKHAPFDGNWITPPSTICGVWQSPILTTESCQITAEFWSNLLSFGGPFPLSSVSAVELRQNELTRRISPKARVS